MKIKVDIRERDLWKLLVPLCRDLNLNIELETATLPLGDIILMSGEDELLIIERKSLRDLAASIKDGRYEEQSYRLNNMEMHNHNIMYLIEGNINTYNGKYTKIPKKTLYSVLCCLQYYKGFSLVRTMDIMETAEYILRMADKISREKNVYGYFNGGEKQSFKNYCQVVKKEKKKNITPNNIGSIILSQIPSISSVTSLAIMEKYGSLYKLLGALKMDRHCLNNFTYMTKGKKMRHLSKTCISNLIKYLLYQDEPVINVKI